MNLGFLLVDRWTKIGVWTFWFLWELDKKVDGKKEIRGYALYNNYPCECIGFCNLEECLGGYALLFQSSCFFCFLTVSPLYLYLFRPSHVSI